MSDEVNFKNIIIFNYRSQKIYKKIESTLKKTSLLWENLFDRYLSVGRIYDQAYKLTNLFIQCINEAEIITVSNCNTEFLKLFY